MNDTMVTVVGNVATNVEYRESVAGGMARFRFAVTPRRWDRQSGSWTDGHTSFYTVCAWRSLAVNLAGSVSVGEPLLVHGRLKVREEERDGQRRMSVEIDAVSVGHDLARGTSAFRRVVKADPNLTAARPAGSSTGRERLTERAADRFEKNAAGERVTRDSWDRGVSGSGDRVANGAVERSEQVRAHPVTTP
ncbi:single-stranded DNA-binding protein [Streptomyces sp. NBC_00829]|uniref:single-stranded DNA-binding protein n=1 Tax=Streptomyces sp. NBC_00829 TaxID=2903679 RepID=UPI00386578AF|nr:single-stranded DNA-binding protein [Streptomyces sp. NBC_00829]